MKPIDQDAVIARARELRRMAVTYGKPRMTEAESLARALATEISLRDGGGR